MLSFARFVPQFVDVLIKRKAKKILQPPISSVLDRTFALKITLTGISEQLFNRIIEVPASVSLAVLHDKILSSVMGWCRSYELLLSRAFQSRFGTHFNLGAQQSSDFVHVRMYLCRYAQVPWLCLHRRTRRHSSRTEEERRVLQ